MKIAELLDFLDRQAPFAYAEDWDNVGLLLGDPEQQVEGVLTSIELSKSLIEEAKAKKANVLITHHPIMFRGVKKIRFDQRINDAFFIRELIRSNIAHISMHTNFDRAPDALHMHLMQKLKVEKLKPLEKLDKSFLREEHKGQGFGYGLCGSLKEKIKAKDFIERCKEVFQLTDLRFVGDLEQKLQKIAFVSGTGMFLYRRARMIGVDLYISGDVKYHEAVDALNDGMSLLDVGHFGAEKHFCEVMQTWLTPKLDVPVEAFWGEDPFTFV